MRAVVLMDYLLPRDVIKAVAKYRITGLAAVPPLWIQLAELDWPEAARASLRYITNSGGAMPQPITQALRALLPQTRIYLMYGLTEAFRSTYLPPEQVDIRPDSMGKAIPNAEILVVREDGSPCAPGEPGELVHRGALVSLGYWNDPERTAERFKPAPGQPRDLPNPELAVWSGDQVRRDEEGYLYFIGRKDEMIKTSGYRVSPTEVEEVVYASGLVAEAAAIGRSPRDPGSGHRRRRQGRPRQNADLESRLLDHCRSDLPGFMVPHRVIGSTPCPAIPTARSTASCSPPVSRTPASEHWVDAGATGPRANTTFRFQAGELIIGGIPVRRTGRAGWPHALLCLRPGRPDRPCRRMARCHAQATLAALRDQGQPHAGRGATPGRSDGRLDVASLGELNDRARCGHARASDQLRRTRQDGRGTAAAVAAGVIINLESAGELDRASPASARPRPIAPRSAVRVNPDFELKTSGMKMSGGPKPFGVDAEQVPAMLAQLANLPVQFRGFHIFTGSQNLRPEAIIEAHNQTFALAERLAEVAPTPVG